MQSMTSGIHHFITRLVTTEIPISSNCWSTVAQMGAVRHLKTDKKRKYLSQLSQLIFASLIFSDLVIRKLVSSEVCKVDDNVVAVLDLVFE